MNILKFVYWLKLGLGIMAAFVCAGYGIVTGEISNSEFALNTLINSVSLAIIIYILSYYLIKLKFQFKTEKPQKLFMMGIGVYFISWLVFWVILYTIIAST